jgi:hypothetical protein
MIDQPATHKSFTWAEVKTHPILPLTINHLDLSPRVIAALRQNDITYIAELIVTTPRTIIDRFAGVSSGGVGQITNALGTHGLQLGTIIPDAPPNQTIYRQELQTAAAKQDTPMLPTRSQKTIKAAQAATAAASPTFAFSAAAQELLTQTISLMPDPDFRTKLKRLIKHHNALNQD